MIHTFVRHCNHNDSVDKRRPDWFNREKIFDQLNASMRDSDSLIAFHDSGNGPLEDHFLMNKEVKTISASYGTDAGSIRALLSYIYSQDLDLEDIIYLVEDDYIHRPNWGEIIEEGIGISSYVTLYDHADKYTNMYSNLKSKILVTKSVHWRTVPSTTNTYACKVRTLLEDFPIHLNHCQFDLPDNDHRKFLELGSNNRTVVSCIPGYSTHVHQPWMAPCVDWESYIDTTKR